MEIKTSLNPVGKVVSVPGLDDLIGKMKQAWADLKVQLGKVDWNVAIQFLSKCLDDIIVYLVQHEIPGADKKATVLNAVGKLYDTVVVGLIPFWAKPFSGAIRSFVIDTVLSHSIDFIVAKYNSGAWSPKATTSVLALWSTPIKVD